MMQTVIRQILADVVESMELGDCTAAQVSARLGIARTTALYRLNALRKIGLAEVFDRIRKNNTEQVLFKYIGKGYTVKEAGQGKKWMAAGWWMDAEDASRPGLDEFLALPVTRPGIRGYGYCRNPGGISA